MKALRRLSCLAATAILAGVAAIAVPQSTRAAETIPILLCPFGCGPMAGDTILMNQLIKEGSDVILLPQETPGYMYNIIEMGQTKRKWKSSIFKTEGVLIQIAYAGGSPEMKEFVSVPVKIPWKILYGEMWWGQGKFLGTFDCNLKTMADLKGKKFMAPGAVANWLKGTGAIGINGGLPVYYNNMKTGVADGAIIITTGM